MAYLALARKWRPRNFSEVVGQDHVVQALSNALDSGRVHHAFLFTGTRGVGKTTIARIFAKSLNCEQGVSAEPCLQCSTCLSIEEGRYVDLIEVDAASRTKVDDTRELLENVQYAPTSGKYKVYLIDEVHMLSGHSFNALLKTLEEPPEHVKFLFATTDPQKLPVTVLSRCLQFNLRAMRPQQVENQLLKIITNESIEFDQQALHLLARAADGSMRDGLSLLDQAIAQGGGEVRQADVESMLGTIKYDHTQAIISALVNQDGDKIMDIVQELADNAIDFSIALDEVLMQLYYISLAQLVPNSIESINQDKSTIKEYAELVDQETIQLYYQIGLISKRDISLAPSLRVGFEMALLRMLAFEPLNESTTQIQSPASNNDLMDSSQLAPQKTPQKPPQKTTYANQSISETPLSDAMTESHTRKDQDDSIKNRNQTRTTIQARSIPSVSKSAESGKTEQINETKVSEQQTPSAIAVTLAGNNEWGELIEQTNLMGLSKELAMNCACEKMAEDKIVLSLSEKLEHLFKQDRLSDIQQQIQLTVGSQTQVELNVEESEKETPAECLNRLGHEQLLQTKQNLANDPGVKALISEFEATINEQTIKPV